jgi:acyl-CoA thioester hydrolase
VNAPARTLEAEVELEVGFHDVDAMEIAWHGNYLKYFEHARCALLKRFDYDYPRMRESGYDWPIVDCRLRYAAPARYGQKLLVRATLKEWESRLVIDYLVRDKASGEKLTTGTTTQVAVKRATGELQFASPPALLERLERAWRG